MIQLNHLTTQLIGQPTKLLEFFRPHRIAKYLHADLCDDPLLDKLLSGVREIWSYVHILPFQGEFGGVFRACVDIAVRSSNVSYRRMNGVRMLVSSEVDYRDSSVCW